MSIKTISCSGNEEIDTILRKLQEGLYTLPMAEAKAQEIRNSGLMSEFGITERELKYCIRKCEISRLKEMRDRLRDGQYDAAVALIAAKKLAMSGLMFELDVTEMILKQYVELCVLRSLESIRDKLLGNLYHPNMAHKMAIKLFGCGRLEELGMDRSELVPFFLLDLADLAA